MRDNQHNVFPERLEEYVRVTGLPRDEYFDHLQDPPSEWLAKLKVLLMVGENDHGHWIGGKSLGDKREMFMAGKYAAGGADVHVGLVPKYTHMGHWALHNEKITYAWLWALETAWLWALEMTCRGDRRSPLSGVHHARKSNAADGQKDPQIRKRICETPH